MEREGVYNLEKSRSTLGTLVKLYLSQQNLVRNVLKLKWSIFWMVSIWGKFMNMYNISGFKSDISSNSP